MYRKGSNSVAHPRFFLGPKIYVGWKVMPLGTDQIMDLVELAGWSLIRTPTVSAFTLRPNGSLEIEGRENLDLQEKVSPVVLQHHFSVLGILRHSSSEEFMRHLGPFALCF